MWSPFNIASAAERILAVLLLLETAWSWQIDRCMRWTIFLCQLQTMRPLRLLVSSADTVVSSVFTCKMKYPKSLPDGEMKGSSESGVFEAFYLYCERSWMIGAQIWYFGSCQWSMEEHWRRRQGPIQQQYSQNMSVCGRLFKVGLSILFWSCLINEIVLVEFLEHIFLQ